MKKAVLKTHEPSASSSEDGQECPSSWQTRCRRCHPRERWLRSNPVRECSVLSRIDRLGLQTGDLRSVRQHSHRRRGRHAQSPRRMDHTRNTGPARKTGRSWRSGRMRDDGRSQRINRSQGADDAGCRKESCSATRTSPPTPCRWNDDWWLTRRPTEPTVSTDPVSVERRLTS